MSRIRRRHLEQQKEAPSGIGYQRLKSRLSSERWNAKYNGITNFHLPDRGEEDADSREIFSGLSRMKLAFQGLTHEEQATNSTNDRVLAHGDTNAERAVDSNHIKEMALKDEHVNARFNAGVLNVPGLSNYPRGTNRAFNDNEVAVDLKSYKDKVQELNTAIGDKADKTDLTALGKKVKKKITAEDALKQMKRKLKPSAFKGN